MARKKTPGLSNVQASGTSTNVSTGGVFAKALYQINLKKERFLATLVERARQASIYGVRPKRTFEEAAA